VANEEDIDRTKEEVGVLVDPPMLDSDILLTLCCCLRGVPEGVPGEGELGNLGDAREGVATILPKPPALAMEAGVRVGVAAGDLPPEELRTWRMADTPTDPE
jgi:hypothetical protein